MKNTKLFSALTFPVNGNVDTEFVVGIIDDDAQLSIRLRRYIDLIA